MPQERTAAHKRPRQDRSQLVEFRLTIRRNGERSGTERSHRGQRQGPRPPADFGGFERSARYPPPERPGPRREHLRDPPFGSISWICKVPEQDPGGRDQQLQGC